MMAFLRLSAPYWRGPTGLRAWGLTLCILLFGIFQVLLAVRLNLWSADLFDALERRSSEGFLIQLGIFAAIVLSTMAVNALHLHVKRVQQLEWRQWLTERLIGEWMHDGNQFRLNVTAGDHSNPDGRIAEDIRIATEAAVDLTHSLFYCTLLLISFIGILWGLSGVIVIPVADIEIALPGHMVWLAFLYAGAGSLLAMYIGRRLIYSAEWRQTEEANLRYALVHGRDNAETIALARSEADERAALSGLFRLVAAAWHSQTIGLRQLILFSSAYSTLASFFPILISTPRFLAGAITLGGLMQTAQAFQQATSALSWPVDNFPKLAELRASIERVLALHEGLQAIAASPAAFPEMRIELVRTPGPGLTAHGLVLREPDGRPISTPFDLDIAPGDRVLLSGDMRTIVVLSKVIAGVWPWGSGRLELPEGPIFVSPELPYIPSGSLRHVIAYPVADDQSQHAAITQSLADADLHHLLPRLDDSDDWGKVLTTAELQRLGFARLIFHRPAWLLLDRAASTLDESAEQEIMLRLIERLPNATILAADPRPRGGEYYTRRLIVDRSASGIISVQDEPLPAASDAAESLAMKDQIAKLLHWIRAGFGGY